MKYNLKQTNDERLKTKISAVVVLLYLCTLISCRGNNNNQDQQNAGETGIDQYDGTQEPETTPEGVTEPQTTGDSTNGGSPHNDSLSGSQGTISQPATRP